MANSQTFTFNIKAVADMKDVVSNVQNIQNALKQLKLPTNVQESFRKTFGELDKELDKYQKLMAGGFKTKGDANALEKSGNNILHLYEKIVSTINSLDDSTLKKAFADLGAKEVENLKNQLTQLQDTLKQKVSTKKGSFINLDNAKTQLADFKSKLTSLGDDADKAFKKLFNSTFNTFAKNLSAGNLDLAANNLKSMAESAAKVGDSKLINWVQQLQDAFDNLTADSDIKSITKSIEQLKSQLSSAKATALQNLLDQFKQGKIPIENMRSEIGKLISDTIEWGKAQAQAAKEIDQIKSRIQYFFGLSNAINLVKRAIRGAVDTIKELDKAMTETAVVTDFTVSDMWKQLPEYTKRANELGVTTLAAYEAATLYYQQGLKTNEVNALSVETLKMARIAGLDAAEATDRMTNALRGFNMELTTANAQRVDDVYSELAANTASNVDEISTAMTKVASLAHNANMEFETTAAFLSQIIETTRESAETAGTALKTVVARFSEVKKLVDEGTLRGQDEEGQVIDVNRVGAALRTAGIDLNKYFLGEVGLDDIFMELASKWDTLTSVQQRYIATQAAGSRQQSRFIALMQDYARTQELVGKAYNANGASARQFAKTQESLESKLNRLKNAWNEFLMGLTNNVMVKRFVDLLTDLLNVVNKLTSAFGDFGGSIAKWGLVIAGIFGGKALFKSGGLLDNALGALTQNTMLGAALGQKGIGGKYNGAAKTVAKQMGATAAGGHSGLGTGIWNGAKNLGAFMGFGTTGAQGLLPGAGAELTGSAGLAAGLGGIVTALGAVAVAAAAAYGVYQLWLHVSVEGKLKTAQKEAEKLKKQSEEIQKELQSRQSLQESYQESTAKVESATTIADKKAAIAARNEEILNQLQEDGSLAEYIITEKIDDQIVLTINEDALAAAITKGITDAEDASIAQQFGEAAVDYNSAKVAEKQLFNIWNRFLGYDENAKSYTVEEQFENLIHSDTLSIEDQAKVGELYSQILNSYASAGQKAEIGYGQRLTQLQASDELTNALLPILGELFESTGQTLSKDQIERLSKLDDSFIPILNAFNGQGFQTQSLADIDINNKEDLASYLGLKDLQTGFKDLETAIGLEEGTILKRVKQNAAEYKKIQERTQQDAILQMIQNGKYTSAQMGQYLQLDNFEDQSEINNLLSKFADSDFGNEIINAAIQAASSGKWQDSELQKWINSLDFSKPIEGFEAIKQAAENSVNPAIKQLAISIQNSNDYTKQFSDSAQLTYFLLSESYNELTDQLADFIEENGSISSANIKELAKSNKELGLLLKNNIVSAKGLATILTHIEDGTIAVTDLNEAIIAAAESMDDLNGITETIIKELNDFDPGYDENDVTSFITKVFDNATENIEKGAYGNNIMANYMRKIFGEFKYTGDEAGYKEAYKTWINNNVKWLENNKDNMFSAWSDFAKTLNNKMLEVAQIYEKDGEIIIEANGMTTDELIDAMVKTGRVTETQARMMIADFKNYSADFAHEMALNDLPQAIEAWADETAKKGWYLDSDLDTLSTILNVDREKIEEELKKYDGLFTKIDLGEGTSKDILTALSQLQGIGGTVDLTNRPKVSAKELERFGGWKGAGEGEATVFSSPYSNEAGTIAANFTPILPDGNFLTPEALQKYAEEVLAGTKEDTLHLQIGAAFEGEDAIEQAKEAAQQIHEVQSALYEGAVDNYNNLKQAFDDAGLGEYFNNVVNDLVDVGEQFNITIGNKIVPVVRQAGESVQEAIDRTKDSFADEQLAGNIGQALKDAIGDSLKLEFLNFDTAVEQAEDVNNQLEVAEQLISDIADEAGVPTLVNDLNTGITKAGEIKKQLNEIKNGNYEAVVHVSTDKSSISVSGAAGTVTFNISAAAAGGLVRSLAAGSSSQFLQPGFALTGEEGPEIIWNKEKGYAYVTGRNGAQFQNLQPGDRVFNAQETSRIFRNSSFAKGGMVPSYASGYGDANKNGGGGSGSAADKEKEEKWKNEVDWLYNLVEDIAELERVQTKLQEDYEDYLIDEAKTGKDLYNLLIQQLGNLYTQLDHQTFALEKREQEMREFMDTTNQYDDYLWYNWNDRTLEIDWDRIEALKDNQKDTYDEIVDLISEAEDIQGKMDDAEDAVMDIQNQIQELENIWRDTFTDFEDRVYTAIVKRLQEVIDNYSELNETLNSSNQAILQSIQKEISLQRQIRDNTKTEEEIANDEAQLAFLRRDTSGANDLAAMELEKQLADNRENYENTLIDQAIARLQDDNDAAAQQREHQIEIMQAQLDYQEQSGEFNAMVLELLQSAMGADGELLTNSDLVDLLKDQENWGAMSDVSKQVWEEELNTTFKEVAAFLLKENAEQNGTFITALTGAIGAVNSSIGSYSQGMMKYLNESSSSSSGGGGSRSSTSSSTVGGKKKTVDVYETYSGEHNLVTLDLDVVVDQRNLTGGGKAYYTKDGKAYVTYKKYATGGLNTSTGPAWLDGTPSEPEYVLNARQTDAFLRLADVLPAMFGNSTNSNVSNMSNITLNLAMNVDKISSDYDVDRIADRVKEIVYNAGSYRNVNTLSFVR